MKLALLLLLGGAVLPAAGTGAGGEYRAFWADAFHAGFRTPGEVDRMLDDLVTAKANAVFIEARHRGAVYYLRSKEPPTEDAGYQPGFDALEYTIEKARDRGIEVHLWSPVTPLWDPTRPPPRDPRHLWHVHGPAAPGNDLWMTATAAGKVSNSIDLGHPAAAKYVADVFIDALREYELDGIHLDYIRYPEDDRYGWNPATVARFNRLHGRDGSPAESDPAWGDFRRKQVTDFVRQVYLRAYEMRPPAKVSASVITWGNGPASDADFRTRDAYARVYQDWPSWLAEGIIDFAMPMNYVANARYSSYLDRWLEFEKDRQFGRAVMPGLGIYLNPIPDGLSQIDRALAPSQAGNAPAGVALYSYASTNTLTNNVPATPNAQFYRALADRFKENLPPPMFAWKSAPQRGHVLGTLTVDGSPAWLNDGVDVTIESDTQPDVVKRTTTDSTGFFGAVDLKPDRYFVRLSRAGQELFRTVPLEVAAGGAPRFDIFLKDADFAGITPRVLSASQNSGAPGELISLAVANLYAASDVARTVPLPRTLSNVQVYLNGTATALSLLAAGRIDFQLPFVARSDWSIVVRSAGMDSAPFVLPLISAKPRIEAVRRLDWGLEIYAAGLGATNPAPSPGAGGAGAPPYNVLANPVEAFLRTASGDIPLRVFWAGLEPYQPYRYQVNVSLPDDVTTGELVLRVAGVSSPPFTF
jgi:uncharacterized lipoprotein YddW (UPF0748 family)